MSNSANNLYRLIENLLQWSRNQRGSIPFNPEILQMATVAEESIAMTIEPAKSKKIAISTDIAVGLEVFADQNMLQTIIRNLLSNAVKFTPRGGNVSFSAKSTNDHSVEIAISDSGIGMSPEMIDNLFRIDIQTSRKGTDGEPSTGLGLLLCKEFVDKHGGKIWVESEVGKGSCFYFTLPTC
jgi:signal transduction histidine kinase